MNHKSFFPDWTVAYCTSGLEQEIQRCQMKQNLNHILGRKNNLFKKYKVNSFKHNLNFINLKFIQSAKCMFLLFSLLFLDYLFYCSME